MFVHIAPLAKCGLLLQIIVMLLLMLTKVQSKEPCIT